MGYRSEVVIALNKTVIAKLVLTGNTLPKLFLYADNQLINDCAYYYIFEGIKWYQEYPEIIYINSFLDTLDIADFGFIRSGDEVTDIEILGSPYNYDMYLEKHLSYPSN